MKKGKIITIISVSILCLSLFSTLVFSEGFASRLCEVITLVTAVIGVAVIGWLGYSAVDYVIENQPRQEAQ